ncbi:MAG: KEOPS complex subunit Pcc1 [Candidatus Hodarchaeota archaeon]
MNQYNIFTIKATVELIFTNSETCDISYNSLLPEFNKQKTKRSKMRIEKKSNSIVFYLESIDITAFRASINDIIGFGKIIEGVLEITTK